MQTYTPEQIAILDGQLGQTTTVKQHNADINALKENDAEIIEDLEALKDGQSTLKKEVETGFEKGRKRMDGIEGEMKDMKDMIREGDKKRDEQHNEILNKITDNEITRLSKKLEEKDDKIAKQEARKWDLTRGGAIVFFGIIGAVFLYLIGVK